MNLDETIQQALLATEELHRAFADDDLLRCAELLPARGEAMRTFEAAHLYAAPAEATACRDLLRRLQEADARLQTLSVAIREALAGEFRSGLSSHREYEPCAQACIDRKA